MNKNILITLLLSIAPFGGALQARVTIKPSLHEAISLKNYPEFAKFVQKFAPPAHIAAEIEKHKEIIFSLKEHSAHPFGLFGKETLLVVKGKQIERVINAYCLRKLIKKWGLTDIVGVPAKYVYNLDGNWLVFTEYISADGTQFTFTDEQLQKLIGLQKEVAYIDFHEGNVVVNNGKAFIIDTEDRSFSPNGNACIQRMLLFLRASLKRDSDGNVIWYNHRFNSKNINFSIVRDEFTDLDTQLQQVKDKHD